ncbi:RlpA-like double-psi beta-barrel-protein domain-containing protein-containing protein [Mycena filopes]|nr:RlpA-like double-psi beta-barrel-protein domain-containing protein-containing protein [Mycena filopes]
MFPLASAAVLALTVAGVSAHSFSHLRRHHVPRQVPPAGWATSYLEPYTDYHTRYMAVGCENKHNTTFFDSCCHPLLATESLAKNRPACCAVGATVACPGTSASSSAAPSKSTGTSTSNEDDDEDCDDEDDTTSGNEDENTGDNEEEDCDDEDEETGDNEDEDCDDEGNDSSAPAATSTHVATTHTTAAAVTTTHTNVKATPTSTTQKETTTSTTEKETTTSTNEKETTTAKATTTHTTTSTASTPDKTSSGSLVLGGFGTWFTQNGVAGACGTVHKDTDFVVALETKTYDKGVNCGRRIQIIDASNGKSVEGVVADECPTCTNSQSVDMSLGMFKELAALSVGEFSIKWKFLPE